MESILSEGEKVIRLFDGSVLATTCLWSEQGGRRYIGTAKCLEIWGFKKFSHLHVDFNEKTNIIVGENEAGKSTLLEAINIVLNQMVQECR